MTRISTARLMSALMLVAAACTAAPQPQREAPCPFTVPNGGPPPGNTGPANFADGKLWVWVPGGKLYLAPDSDGRLSEKFGWWREVPGTLTIEATGSMLGRLGLTRRSPTGMGRRDSRRPASRFQLRAVGRSPATSEVKA